MEETERIEFVPDGSAAEPGPAADLQERPTKAEMSSVFSRIGLGLCLGLLVSQLSPLALKLIPGFDVQAHSFLVGGLCTGCFTLPLMLLLTRPMPARKPEKNRLSVGAFLALVCISYAAMIAGNLLGIGVNMLLSPRSVNLVSNLAASIDSPMEMLLAFVIMAPVFEELVFRKVLVDRVLPYGEWPAIVFSGLTFGLFHGNLTQFFYACILGMILAYVYIRTGNVLYTIGIHACINCMGGLLPILLPLVTYVLLQAAIAGVVLIIVLRKSIRVDRNAVPGAGRAMFLNGGMILFLIISGAMMALVAIALNHPELVSLG